jgi:hypothetical protein
MFAGTHNSMAYINSYASQDTTDGGEGTLWNMLNDGVRSFDLDVCFYITTDPKWCHSDSFFVLAMDPLNVQNHAISIQRTFEIFKEFMARQGGQTLVLRLSDITSKSTCWTA